MVIVNLNTYTYITLPEKSVLEIISTHIRNEFDNIQYTGQIEMSLKMRKRKKRQSSKSGTTNMVISLF
jgi:hypothetical protein